MPNIVCPLPNWLKEISGEVDPLEALGWIRIKFTGVPFVDVVVPPLLPLAGVFVALLRVIVPVQSELTVYVPANCR